MQDTRYRIPRFISCIMNRALKRGDLILPELPEVETIKSGLNKQIKGLRITNVKVKLPKIIKNSSVQEFTNLVTGKVVEEIRRRAKYLIITISSNLSIIIHLKLTGQLIYCDTNTPLDKYTHVVFFFDNKHELRYNDMRQFGSIMVAPDSQLPELSALGELGPEPLAEDFTLSRFNALLQKRKQAKIKPLLMNQNFIAGIGNLYADEILFYAKIHPLQKVSNLTATQIAKIYQGIREILTDAIKHRGTSVDSYVDAEGKKGGHVPYLQAYRREGQPCYRCTTPIQRIKIGNRSAYFCPKCQKL
jgi:formamidopyrimidine-DNA glycosylase